MTNNRNFTIWSVVGQIENNFGCPSAENRKNEKCWDEPMCSLKKVINKNLILSTIVYENRILSVYIYMKQFFSLMFLTEILENAVQEGTPKNADIKKKHQRDFEKIIIMKYRKKEFGIIKLTVGVKRGTKEKIQYCVTAIKNDQ